MGNCCGRESAAVPQKHPPMEEECLVGDDNKAPRAAAATTPLKEQVTIKITKRELEELLASARMEGVPVDRVLSRFVDAVDHSHVQRQHAWAPTLHSIAE